MSGHVKWVVLGPVLLVLMVLMTAGVEAQPGNKEVTVKEIQQAWQNRRHAIKTFRMSWEQQDLVERSFYHDGSFAFANYAKGQLIPAVDTRWTGKNQVILSGRNGRTEWQTRSVSSDPNGQSYKFKPQKWIIVGTEKTLTFLKIPEEPETTEDFPQAVISPGGLVQTKQHPVPAILWRNFYPATSAKKTVTDSQGYKIAATRVLINKRPCIELRKNKTKSLVAQLWVDPAREFLPVAYSETHEGRVMLHQTFEYRKEGDRYLPTVWRSTERHFNKNASQAHHTTARVTDCVINEPVNDTTFALQLPPGTVVLDDVVGKHYVIKLDGTERKILPDEVEAGYKKVLETDTGGALPDGVMPPRRPLFSGWLFYSLLAVVLVAIGYGGWRLWKWRIRQGVVR